MQIKIEDENTLGFHKQQMTEKQIKKQDEKAKILDMENQNIQAIVDGMKREREETEHLKEKTKVEFWRWNED